MWKGLRPHIVVVEDNQELASTICDTLEMCGCRVTMISHPFAMAGFDDGEPDLILVDTMLPGMSGCKLAARLRETRFPHTPMIALSSDGLMLHFAKRSGLFQDFLRTPVDQLQLLECVGRYVGIYVT